MKLPWRRHQDEPQPPPPENVRLVLPDGSVVPVECVYAGFHEDCHQWVAAWPVGLPPHTQVAIEIDVLPAHTGVRLAVYPGDDDSP